MTDQECVDFLQWALPRLVLRWTGFRKVRGQMHKRLNRRLDELGFAGISDYRRDVETCSVEWSVPGGYMLVSTSRFCWDRGVWERLRNDVLLELPPESVTMFH